MKQIVFVGKKKFLKVRKKIVSESNKTFLIIKQLEISIIKDTQ